jgi:Xaa-Pro aminopeptidase
MLGASSSINRSATARHATGAATLRRVTTAVTPDRLDRARRAAATAGLDALLLGAGADLRYLTGYDTLPLPRLTCLVLPVDGDPVLLVPRLEAPRTETTPVASLGVEVRPWDDTDDPHAVAARLLPGATTVGVSDRTWAMHVFAFGEALPGAKLVSATPVLRELRMRKSAEEVEALREAGRIIDAVHAEIQTWRVAGRTEAEVGRDIAAAILAGGNERVNFVIVGSGPNGASPHHDVSSRVIEPGDAVVFDIGGTTPAGYCSDITRTYVVGEAPEGFAEMYSVLQAAQEAACAAVRPGVTCESVDRAARDMIEAAGFGEHFIHRTGHGIGVDEHEDPYIVAGNDRPLEAGMAFSIEPGIYLPGRYGARIEDIVVCTDDGGERLNLVDRSLVALAG